MDPQETGMQVCDSDGGELPDRASGSCHTGLISPVTRHEVRPVTRHEARPVTRHEAWPVTRRSSQQVMKTGWRRGDKNQGLSGGKKTHGQDVMWRHRP